jgi:hypothetical protein
LNNLARQYQVKANIESERVEENMRSAVKFGREAARLTDPIHGQFCFTQGIWRCTLRTEEYGQDNGNEIVEYRKLFSTEAGDMADRLISTDRLANRLLLRGCIETLDKKLGLAIALIPKLQIQALHRESQQKRVTLVSELSCLAAAALSSSQAEEAPVASAISRLEQGRSCFWHTAQSKGRKPRAFHSCTRTV